MWTLLKSSLRMVYNLGICVNLAYSLPQFRTCSSGKQNKLNCFTNDMMARTTTSTIII